MIKIYLDSCVIIYLIENHPKFTLHVQQRLTEITSYEACYSPLSEMECLVMPLRNQDTELVKVYQTYFAAQSRLTISASVFRKAAHLRADFPNLRTPDELHLATSQSHECDELWTNDDRLCNIAPALVRNIFSADQPST